MATQLKIAAQYAMDSFLKSYRVTTDFFDITDFTFHCAAAAAAVYQALYDKEYARMRSDGQKDEVVAFSNDFLSTQILDVKSEGGEVFAKLKENVFSFAYDQSNVGVQNVFCFTPAPQYELERGDIDELWQYQHLPVANKIFWALDGDRILLIKKGVVNVSKIRVLYVPEISANNPEVLLPDGIVKAVMEAAVESIRTMGGERVIKKTTDLNENASPQTETNKNAVV